VEFRILGPLEVEDDGRVAPLGGAKQRALLALLLLHANEIVPRDRLIDDIWGDRAPETAATALQGYVSGLRKALGSDRILTRAPGYLLQLDSSEVDLGRFERLAREGREALADGDAERAAALLSEALALWRGPPLADLDATPFAYAERLRLGELRVSAIEERIESELALGRHAALVAELEALLAEHPLRERLRGQLMLALYRCGRHAEALDAFQAFRRMLHDELGIDPPSRLKELERLMLQQDASLDHEPQEQPTGSAPDESVAVSTFARTGTDAVGRERELTRLEQLRAEAHTGARRLAFVTGDAGIGKTTIVETFISRAGNVDETLVAHGQCVEHRGAGEPYLPLLDALGGLARRPAARQLVPLLARHAPTWVAQMPWLLSDDELEAVHRRLIGATHERMLREMLETL
jgi:DNA-binding SARP family transcriptional activator